MTIEKFEKKYEAKWKEIENQFYIKKYVIHENLDLEKKFIEWFGFSDDLNEIEFFYNKISYECMKDLIIIWKELKGKKDDKRRVSEEVS